MVHYLRRRRLAQHSTLEVNDERFSLLHTPSIYINIATIVLELGNRSIFVVLSGSLGFAASAASDRAGTVRVWRARRGTGANPRPRAPRRGGGAPRSPGRGLGLGRRLAAASVSPNSAPKSNNSTKIKRKKYPSASCLRWSALSPLPRGSAYRKALYTSA